MSKTSIDGLMVRSSDEHKRVVRPSAHRVIGQTRTAARTTATKKHKIARRASARDEFLAPLSTFGVDEPDTSLGSIDDADWSELLEGFGDAKPTEGLGLERRSKKLDEPKLRPSRQRPQRAKREHKICKRRKIFLLRHPIFSTIVILLLGIGIGTFVWGDSLISKLTSGKSGLWDAIGSLVSTTVPFETDSNGRTNVLVFGTEGYDMTGASGNGTHDGSQLTDSIMVISFDQETQDVALLSLPRDLKVPMACMAGKVNEVYVCNNQNGNNEEAGARALMEQVSAVIGVDFQYWAHVNWGSLAEIVDTLGGITVTLDEDINDYNYTKVVLKAGVPTRLTGEQAIALSRARHGTTGGDFTRGNSQQKIVEGIIQEFVAHGVNISEAISLMGILGDNLRTNFTTDNIKAGVKLASTFSVSNIRNVPLVDYNTNTYYVTTAMINGISYVVPSAGASNYAAIQGYVARMFSSDAAMREDATIAVYNATGEAGVASAERSRLQDDNYDVNSIGDAATGSCEEQYCLYVLDEEKSATRAALEARYGVVAKASTADVWYGYADFILVIGRVE